MSKFEITPSSGTIAQAKDISFAVTLRKNDKGVRIRFENATNRTEIRSKLEVRSGLLNVAGKISLNIPEHSSHAAISIYAIIEERMNDGWRAIDILPAVYDVTERPDEEFDGQLTVTPAYIGPNDRAKLNLTYKPNSRVAVSINDRRFAILTDDSGKGSLSVSGSDVLNDSKVSVVQKFLVNALTTASSYSKALFTGAQLHVFPSNIAMLAAQAETADNERAPKKGGFLPTEPHTDINNLIGRTDPTATLPSPLESMGEPKVTSDGSTTLVAEASNTNVVSSNSSIISIPDHAVAQTPWGFAVHGYIAVTSTGSIESEESEEDPGGEAEQVSRGLPKVYLAKQTTSLAKAPITEARTGVVTPGTGNITLYVDEDIFAQVEAGNMVALLKSDFNYSYYKILELVSPTEYVPFYQLILEADIEVPAYLFCVPYIVYGTGTPASATSFPTSHALPEITDAVGNAAIPLTVSVAVSKKVYGEDTSYIYVIAEATSGGVSQLYFYSISTDSTLTEYGWKQLTYRGDNKNPKAVCDSEGNLHIFWESNRSGLNQVYFGILGPSANSYVNSALCSILDKQAEVRMRAEQPLEYTSDPILFESLTPTDHTPARGCDEYAANTLWLKTVKNNGDATITDDQTLSFSGNPSVDQSMVWTTIDDDEQGVTFTSQFDQRCYGVEFKIAENDTVEVSTDNEIKDQWETWKQPYDETKETNKQGVTIYKKDDNKFVLSKVDRYFDRIIPIFGAYKNRNLAAAFAACLEEDDQTFSAILSGCNSTVRHFMLALMPEKVRFKATNAQTFIEFCDEHGGTTEDCQTDYIPDTEEIIYTGRYKLAVILAIDSDFFGSSGQPYAVIRQVGEAFDLTTPKTIRLATHYRKMFLEDVAAWGGGLNKEDYNGSGFLGSLQVVFEDDLVFAESFFVNFCDFPYQAFDLAFGFSSGGQFISTRVQPYDTCVYDFKEVDFAISDIAIGVPNFTYDPTLVEFDPNHRDTTTMNVAAGEDACSAQFFTNIYDWSSFGLDFATFPQIPVTIEGQNQNVDAVVGPFCNDVHLAWQSNRNSFWDIYYTMSLPPTLPFRFDTRITATETHSLMPRVAIDSNGIRVVVWHENRFNDQYQIFAAKGNPNHLICTFDDCGVLNKKRWNNIRNGGDGDTNDGGDDDDPNENEDCEVHFKFCYTPCDDYLEEQSDGWATIEIPPA